jgi:hypothetical protein
MAASTRHRREAWQGLASPPLTLQVTGAAIPMGSSAAQPTARSQPRCGRTVIPLATGCKFADILQGERGMLAWVGAVPLIDELY